MMRRALLSVASLLVACVLLEVLLRTTHLFHARLSWTEPDRVIGWRFAPGREYWFFGENDRAITGRINAMGWRDRERSVKKPPRTYRIAVVGDSYVEAFQVESGRTFLARAEEAYKSIRTPDYDALEVMNFGRSGMSPAEESIVLERDVFPCGPDQVLLLFTPHNDIADVNPATAADACRPFFHRVRGDSLVADTSFAGRRDFRLREAISPIKQRSALVSLVTERYNAWRFARAQRRVEGGAPALTREQRMCTAHPDSVFVLNYALCKLLIARMAHECEARGIRFVLTSVPLVYEDDAVARLRAADSSFDPGFFDRNLAAMADSSGFSFRPMTAEFASRSRHGLQLQWQHWNYSGHQAAFDLLLGPMIPPPGPDGGPQAH
jgi:hypothetical protein